MADGKVTITVDLDGTSAQQGVKRLKSLLQGLGDTSNKGFSSSGKSALGFGFAVGAAAKLVGAGMSLVSNSIGGAVSRFDTMKRFPIMMQSWGYSAKESNGAIKALSKGIDGLPTALDEVVATTQQLTMMNGDLGKSTKLTLALNDAFLASGSSSADASRGLNQFTQMMSSGKVDLQSWKTLMETMPVGLQKTAEAFGFAGASAKQDLYKALQDGTITFDQFSDKLIELDSGVNGFAKLARINSKGIATSFKNIKTAVTKNLANMLDAFDKASKAKGLGGIVENLDKVKDAVNKTFSSATPYVEKFVGVIKKGVDAVTTFWDIFKGTGAVSAIQSAFGAIGGAVGHVIGSLSLSKDEITDFAIAIGDAVVQAVGKIQDLAEWIAKLDPNTIKTVASAAVGMVGAFKGLKTVSATIRAINTALSILAGNKITIVIMAIGALVGAFIHLYNANEKFRKSVDKVLQVLKEWAPAIAAVGGGFAIFKMLDGWNPFKAFAGKGKSAFDRLKKAMKGGSDSATRSKGIIEQVFSGLGTLMTSIAQGISIVLNGMATAISTVAQGFGKAASMANPAQWLSMGAVMLMVGAGVALVSTGIYILVQAAIQLANAGTGAQIAMLALGVDIAALAGIFALLGPALSASAVGIVAFGASVALIGAGIAIAAVGLSVLVNAFANAEGAITATGQAISSAAQGLGQGLQSALNGAAEVVKSFGTAVKTALDGVANVFKSVGEAIRTVLDGIKGIIESVGNSFTKIGDSLAKIAKSAGGIAAAAAGTAALAAAVTSLGAASYSGNLVGFTADIKKLSGAVKELGSGFGKISSSFQTIGASMTLVSTSSLMAVAGLTAFSTKITSLSTTLGTLPTIMTTAASGFANFTAQAVSGVAGLSAINAPIAMFKSQIMTITPALMMAGVGFASFGSRAMVISAAFATVGSLITAFNARVMTISSTITMASSSFTMLSSRVTVVGTALTTVSSGFAQVGSSANNAYSQIVRMATSTQIVSTAFNAMRGGVQASMQAILAVIRSVGAQMKVQGRQIGKQTAQNIAQGIRGGIGQSTSAMRALMSAVRATGMSGVGSMRGIGAMIGQGLAAGMMSALGAVTAAANALVAQAERAARAKAQIHSPSRLFRDSVGRFLPMGVAVGIEKNTKYVDKAMSGMYDNIQAFSYKAEDIIGVGKTKLSNVVQVKSDFENAIKAKVEVAKEKSNDLMKRALDIAEKAVERPSQIVLDDDTLIAKTGDKYDKYQTEQARRRNRMRGIIT